MELSEVPKATSFYAQQEGIGIGMHRKPLCLKIRSGLSLQLVGRKVGTKDLTLRMLTLALCSARVAGVARVFTCSNGFNSTRVARVICVFNSGNALRN